MGRVKDINHIPDIIKNIKAVEKKTIAAGIIGDGESEIAAYAAANEFGTNRAGRNNSVVIPERSWLRSTFDSKAVTDKALRHLDDLFDPRANPKIIVNRIGADIVAALQEKIGSNIPPDNALITKQKKKGTSRTLINKGTMRNAVDFEVRG